MIREMRKRMNRETPIAIPMMVFVDGEWVVVEGEEDVFVRGERELVFEVEEVVGAVVGEREVEEGVGVGGREVLFGFRRLDGWVR